MPIGRCGRSAIPPPAVWPHIDQVGGNALGAAGAIAVEQGRVCIGNRIPAILGLAADELPLLEAAGEVHARHEIVGHIAHKSGMIAGLLQGFGDCALLGGHRLPAGQIDVIPGDRSIVVEGKARRPLCRVRLVGMVGRHSGWARVKRTLWRAKRSIDGV